MSYSPIFKRTKTLGASLFSSRRVALAAVSVLATAVQAAPVAPSAPAASAPAGSAGASSSAAAGASVGTFHVIGPDDVLSIGVQRHPEFSVERAVVSDNGLINVPVAGTIRAAGKTAAQLDKELTAKLKSRLLRPEVIVAILSSAPRPIYVVGEVRTPGVLPFRNGWRITQALAASGGLTVDTDLAAVSVSRGKTQVADVPLLPILRNPSSPQNLALRIGDTLRFYERVVKVNISGAVLRPGIYPVPRGNGVVEAIGLAGGPTDTASLTRATLKRSDGTRVPINLYEALRLGNPKQNVTLREGDVLSIPEYKERVSILGAVKTPGYYPLEDGRSTRIADVIARAGGVAQGAALTRASLQRAGGQIVPLNLYNLLVLGEKENNLVLGSNDVLTIPESRGITVIGAVQKAGTYKLEEGQAPRALDAIAQAGGPTVKADLARVTVSRTLPSGKNVTLNLDPVGLFELSRPEQNPLVQDGDVISVSEVRLSAVSINGFVKLPGVYSIKEGDGLGSLIAQAGGAVEGAALSRVAVRARGGETKVVNAVAMMNGTPGADIVLRDGDNVIVPRNENRILVAGAVTRPNTYALPEDRVITVGEALGLAGGAQPGAGGKQITLYRKTGQGFQEIKLATNKATGGRLAFNELVQKDDVILVPEPKTTSKTLGLVQNFLPALSLFLRR